MPSTRKPVDYEEITEKFKKLLTTDLRTKLSASGRGENCL